MNRIGQGFAPRLDHFLQQLSTNPQSTHDVDTQKTNRIDAMARAEKLVQAAGR